MNEPSFTIKNVSPALRQRFKILAATRGITAAELLGVLVTLGEGEERSGDPVRVRQRWGGS